MKRLLWLLLIIPALALGQEVGSYPNASALTGNERILADQAATYPCVGCTVNLTPAQIATFLLGSGNLFPTYTTGYLYWNGTALQWNSSGSMTWPAAAGIPCYSGSSSWCTSYSASNLIPANFMTVQTFTGDCANSGTLTLTCSKVNGASIPLSAAVAGTDASGHIIAATTTGTGNAVLASAPTIANLTVTGTCTGCGTGSSVTLQTNGTNNTSQTTLNIQNGTGINCSNPSAGNVQCSQSQALNAQTGTTYTIASTDASKLVTFNNASAVAVTLPQATGSFATGFAFTAENLGAGTVTITPTTSTINGGASLTIAQNRGCSIVSDGTNYQVAACNALVSGGGTTPKAMQSFWAASMTQATTYYIIPGISGASTASNAYVPFNATFKNLYVHTANTPASGQTYTFTLYTGAFTGPTATTLTCQITNTSTNNTCSDTTDAPTVTVGQVWTLQAVASATSGTSGNVWISFEVDPQ